MRNEELKELLEANFTAVRAEMKAQTDVLSHDLKELSEHVKQTNGRVKSLECQTGFVRWMHRNPVLGLSLLVVIIAGVVGIVGIVGFETIIEKLIP